MIDDEIQAIVDRMDDLAELDFTGWDESELEPPANWDIDETFSFEGFLDD